ncbi:hypothetical protein AB0937_19155 [Streptomyces sp. NPDC047880]|uniref:hypothetical protein n=1 Tax=Streptomyces sp. NPDC047880 TaxID=3155626 RepID=UPI003456F955
MTTVMLREAQLLVAYPDSPLTATNGAGPGDRAEPGPGPGERAPDCRGLTTGLAVTPLRLYDLLRDRGSWSSVPTRPTLSPRATRPPPPPAG